MDPQRMLERGVIFTSRVPATLHGWKLTFNKPARRSPNCGFANIISSAGSAVEGALYETTEESLRILDRFEGVPNDYRRQEVTVLLSNGMPQKATLYIAVPEMTRNNLKPARDYMQHLLAGKDILSAEYYQQLLQTPTLD